jgi:hypothetical protein
MCPYWWVYITLFLPSIHLYNEWDLHEWISATGHWRWGIHKRKCCSMLDSWNWSSSRYGASKWYITLASLQMLNCAMFSWNLFSLWIGFNVHCSFTIKKIFTVKTFKKTNRDRYCHVNCEAMFFFFLGTIFGFTSHSWNDGENFTKYPLWGIWYERLRCCNFFIVISCNICLENDLWPN